MATPTPYTVTAYVTSTPIAARRQHLFATPIASSSPDPLSLSRPFNQDSPLKANTATALISPHELHTHVTLHSPTRGAGRHKPGGASPWRVHVVVESLDAPASAGADMVREGLRSGDVRIESVPLRGDGGGMVRRKSNASPRKRTPTPKGRKTALKSAGTPKSAKSSGRKRGADELDGNEAAGGSTSAKRRATKKNAAVKSAKRDFTLLTPLYKKIAQESTTPQTPLSTNDTAGAAQVLKTTRGRAATPCRRSLRLAGNSPEVPTDDATQELDFGEAGVHEVTDVDEDQEEEPQARPDSGIEMEDDTSILDQSALEGEEFTMVSIESLRHQREKVMQEIVHHEETSQGMAEKDVRRRGPEPQMSTPARSTEDSTCLSHIHDDRGENDSSVVEDGAADLFAGFGVSTRRHLRDGFALGGRPSQDVQITEHGKPDRRMHYPRLPTPADSVISINTHKATTTHDTIVSGHDDVQAYDMMSWQPTTTVPLKDFHEEEQIDAFAHPHEQTEIGQTQLLERGFQAEREDVRRQILNANTSQVIVLDSSSAVEASSMAHHNGDAANTSSSSLVHIAAEDRPDVSTLYENENTLDAWQAEADRSIAAFAQKSARIEEESNRTPSLRKLFEADARPTRSKIPRTWRRVSDIGFTYSDEMAEAEGGQEDPLTELGACKDYNVNAPLEHTPVHPGPEIETPETMHDTDRLESQDDHADTSIPSLPAYYTPHGSSLHTAPNAIEKSTNPMEGLTNQSEASANHPTISTTPPGSPSFAEEPSDVRQLQIELVATTPGRDTGRAQRGVTRLRSRKAGDNTASGSGREARLKSLAPRRRYPKLLDSPPAPAMSGRRSRQRGTVPGSSPPPQHASTQVRGDREDLPESTEETTSTPAPAPEPRRPAAVEQVAKPSLLRYLSSLIPWPLSFSNPAAQQTFTTASPPDSLSKTSSTPNPSAPTPPTPSTTPHCPTHTHTLIKTPSPLPPWTRHHFSLLTALDAASLAALSSPTPASTSSPPVRPTQDIPLDPRYASLISLPLRPRGRDALGEWWYARAVDARWARVVRDFCVEIGEVGVVVDDHASAPSCTASGGRDDNGAHDAGAADADADDEGDGDGDGIDSSGPTAKANETAPVRRRRETAWATDQAGPRVVVEMLCRLWAAELRRVDSGRKRVV